MPREWTLPPHKERYAISASVSGEMPSWSLEWLGVPAVRADGSAGLNAKTKGKGVKVGVLDTGIDHTHPDFEGVIAQKLNFTDSPDTMDRAGHGTHVAGTIAAQENGSGSIGIAPECELLIYKVLGDDGSGDDQWVVNGIKRAREDKCDVITMSLGSRHSSSMMHDALLKAIADGILITLAAGNEGKSLDAAGNIIPTVDYPAAWVHAGIPVGSIDHRGAVSDFSARGPQVLTVAPGSGITSSWPGNKYAVLDGTSMATPHVAALTALSIAWRRDQNLSPLDYQNKLELALKATSRRPQNDIVPPSWNWGYGVVDGRGLLGHDAVQVVGSPENPGGAKVISAPFGEYLGHNWEIQFVGTPITSTGE